VKVQKLFSYLSRYIVHDDETGIRNPCESLCSYSTLRVPARDVIRCLHYSHDIVKLNRTSSLHHVELSYSTIPDF
jgi:hypothetical protein